jgi:hypothetical protein
MPAVDREDRFTHRDRDFATTNMRASRATSRVQNEPNVQPDWRGPVNMSSFLLSSSQPRSPAVLYPTIADSMRSFLCDAGMTHADQP